MARNQRKVYGEESGEVRACPACGCAHMMRRMETLRTETLVCRHCGQVVATVPERDRRRVASDAIRAAVRAYKAG